MNDELNEEIQELKKELEEYSNELDKLYSSNNTNSQKIIKTIEEIKKGKKRTRTKNNCIRKRKKELEQKIDKKNSINSELSHAVHIIKKNILKN